MKDRKLNLEHRGWVEVVTTPFGVLLKVHRGAMVLQGPLQRSSTRLGHTTVRLTPDEAEKLAGFLTSGSSYARKGRGLA